ncbi:unnamed protein product [Arctogadus glacialis]
MEEKLIIAVGSRPILYDQSLYTYRDTTLKDRAWQDVSLEVGETAAECVKRWRSLRDRYRRERVKEKEAQRSGVKGKTVCLVTGPDEMRRRGNKVCRHEDLVFIK